MRKLILEIIFIIAFLGISINSFSQGKNVLVVLQDQENPSVFKLLDWTENKPFKTAVASIMDPFLETAENRKTNFQAAGKYSNVILLTDKKCKEQFLFKTLQNETRKGNIIDLLIIGHGSTEKLLLKGEYLTGGEDGNIRKMKQKNGGKKFNLRLVYMCNCKAASLNDDWLEIGADVSVGSIRNNYMPEPQITFFFQDFLNSNKTVSACARDSWENSKPFFAAIPQYYEVKDGYSKFSESRPVVKGTKDLKFGQNSDSQNIGFECNKGYKIKHVKTKDVKVKDRVYLSNMMGGIVAATTTILNPVSETVNLNNNFIYKTWKIEKIAGLQNRYWIVLKGKNSTNRPVLQGATNNNDETVVQAAEKGITVMSTHQHWDIQELPDGNYTIRNVGNGKYLYVKNNGDVILNNPGNYKKHYWEFE